MKTQFLIFISIALTIWILLNVFGYRSVRGVFSESGWGRVVLLTSVVVFGSAYILGRTLEQWSCNALSRYLIIVGSYYMGLLIYTCVGGFLSEFAIGVLKLVGLFKVETGGILSVFQKYSAYVLVVFAIAMSFASFINARIPRHTVISLPVDKSVGGLKSFRIAVATDVHLGHIISNGRLNRLVDSLNALDPDVVIFGGDLFDEDLRPVIEADMGAQLRQLKAKHGVYAVLGNHEYIGGSAAASKYLKEHGIKLLRDSSILVENSVLLVGRDDYSSTRFGGAGRQPLHKVMEGLDRTKPIVVIDHQPQALEEAVAVGADLQISGHTHHGQFWPFSLITSALFEVSSGLKMKGGTAIFVSNGYGTWGAPMRMGNRPEFVEINLTFK